MFKFAEFKKLAVLYRERYGAFAMGEETAKMWHNKLKSEDFDSVASVFVELIGGEDKAFGWKKVANLIDIRFPPEDRQMALEKKWKSDPENIQMGDKQRECGAFRRELMDECKYQRKKGETFDWITPYARKFVEVFGREEADRVIRTMTIDQGRTPVEEYFSNAIRLELR